MAKVRLIIGTHNHLPLGLSEEGAERQYQEALKPLLAVVYRYPGVPVTLHYSGILMEWLEETHPEFLTLLGEMVKRGQVEVLGGGYYDPILPLIPTNDKLGQLEKMTTWLRVRFETRPRGCWIAEKVWEPSLSSVLRASGLEYTFVDDSQFRIAGSGGAALWHPAIAEDQGKIITLFPVCSGLAGLVGAAPAGQAIEWLHARAGTASAADGAAPHPAPGTRGPRAGAPGEAAPEPPVVVLLADGATGGLVREGWLEDFLGLAAASADWLELVTPGQYLRENPPDRRIFLPASSPAEMMRWALAPRRREAFSAALRAGGSVDDAGQFVVGGHFRHFLTRCPEAWLMYAKMMNTHVLVNQVRGDRYKKKAAQNELWKGQSHHAYWYGGSGGIYDNALRKAVYQSLIEAEKITRATEIFAPSILSIDYDMDNNIEYLYQGSELNAYIHTRGGSLFELDFLPASWNYLDTMVDRERGKPGVADGAGADGAGAGSAGAGSAGAGSAGIPGAGIPGAGIPGAGSAGIPGPDNADAEGDPRTAFMDHFFAAQGGIEEFLSGSTPEAGDFVTGVYELVELNRALPELLVRRVGSVRVDQGVQPATIEKRFVFRPRSIDVYYRVSNGGSADLAVRFGVEINLSLAGRSPDCGRLFLLEEDRKKEIGSEAADIEAVQSLLVRDVRNEVSVTLSSARSFRLWSLPVETGCGGAAAFQSQCFIPLWDLHLSPGESWENHMSVGFERAQAST